MTNFAKIDVACIRCGACSKKQEQEGMPQIMVGDLAAALDKATGIADIPEKAYEFIRTCNLCNACTARCPSDISCAETVRAARQELLVFAPEIAEGYRNFRVDYQENLFACLREVSDIVYPEFLNATAEADADADNDAVATEAETKDRVSLFMPGCTLCSYSQPLTTAVFDLLMSHGAVDGMTELCCGNPLHNFGEIEAYDRYVGSLIELLERNRVGKIVMACPNCMYSMQATLEQNGVTDIELVPLPELLVSLGIRYSGSQASRPSGAAPNPWRSLTSFSVHDSCPDRFSQRFGKATRQLLEVPSISLLEMESRGLNTICCGSGGLVTVHSRDAAFRRQERRLGQFAATGAECLITSCVSCANMFVASPTQPPVRHYLELICDIQLDWEAMGSSMRKLGKQPKRCAKLPLEQSTLVFSELELDSCETSVGVVDE